MLTPPAPDDRDLVLAQLRASAERRVEGLERDISQLRADRGADNADDEHDPEGVTLSSEWARLTGLHDDAVRELAEVDGALSRRAAGDDGRCIDCGRPIPIARLLARPTATRCVNCAARAGG
jgi:DnaK suppressor protein